MWSEENWIEYSVMMVTFLVTFLLGISKSLTSSGQMHFCKFDYLFLISLIVAMVTPSILNERQIMFYISATVTYSIIDLWVKICFMIKNSRSEPGTGCRHHCPHGHGIPIVAKR